MKRHPLYIAICVLFAKILGTRSITAGWWSLFVVSLFAVFFHPHHFFTFGIDRSDPLRLYCVVAFRFCGDQNSKEYNDDSLVVIQMSAGVLSEIIEIGFGSLLS